MREYGGMNYESTSHKEITKELANDLSVNTAIMYSWWIIYRIYDCITTNHAFPKKLELLI